MPPKDTHETQVPDMPSGSGISVETFDSSLASSTSPGGERQRTDPFGQFQPGASSSFSNDYSQPDTTDSGATFFPMDMDDGPIHETVAPAPHPANSEAPTTVAPPKSNTGLFLGIGLVVLLLLGGGAFVMMGQGDSQPSPELAASALVAAQLEANASIKAEKAEKNTIEILKKVEQAAVIAEQPDPPTAKAVTEVKQVREEVESQLDEVTEVADESREELKRVVQTSPELQEKIDPQTLDNLVNLEAEGLERLIKELPPSVKAMVQRQWEHDQRVRKLEDATATLQQQYARLEELSKAAEEAAARVAAAKPAPSQASPATAPVPAAAPAPAPEAPPPPTGADVPLGKVILNAKPYSKYYLDGREVKMQGRKPLEVPVGKHTLIFQDNSSSRRKEMSIVVSGSRTNRFCWSFDEEKDFCNE